MLAANIMISLKVAGRAFTTQLLVQVPTVSILGGPGV